jgi:hypothetical protein
MNRPGLKLRRLGWLGAALAMSVAVATTCGAGADVDAPTAVVDAAPQPPPASESAVIPAVRPTTSEPAPAQRPATPTLSGQGRRSPFVPLDNPEFLAVEQATYLGDENLVLGLDVDGEARAYPVGMVYYHHVVNDTVAGHPVLVTY